MNRTLGVCGLVALAAALGAAQTKNTMTGQCGKPTVEQSVPAGDQQGHMFTVSQGKCTITAKVNGVVAKEGDYAEHIDATTTQFKNWGVYTVTFDNGDKVFYNYQGVATMKDGVYQTGTNKYHVAGGTGKMKGLSGSGSCKLTGTQDGGVDYTCTGTYATKSSATQ